MVMNQLIHQKSGTENFQNITSNPGPLLLKPFLWVQLSWGDLIIIPLIMIMLILILQSFQLNLTLNLLHIHTPFQSNKWMMMKWTISWNSSTQNMMMIFCMLTSRCFRHDWWSPLLPYFIQSLLCCFINMEEQMLHSKIACHNFLYSTQPRPP